MEYEVIGEKNQSLEMQTVEHYRSLADGYRNSKKYDEMLLHSPSLKLSIKDCSDEKLIE